jgi:hypothetical protein
MEPNGTAVVYPTPAPRSMIPLVSLHPSASGLAAPTGLCYNPRPEAGRIGSTEPTQYKSHKPDSYMSQVGCQLRSQHRFPVSEQTGWGISNGSAPPTCGNPVRSFPQAPTIRSPVAVGLRLKQCSLARNSGTASRAGEQEEMGGDFEPRLSTAFAEAGRHLPPTLWGTVRES